MMADLTLDEVIGQMLVVLREAFDGPERWSYFTDPDPGAGLFRTLAGLTAEDASRSWAGSSVAAHVHHITFGLNASAKWIRGDRSPRNWRESWSVHVVDDREWSQIQDRLRDAYVELLLAISTHATTNSESIGGAIGALAHVAYHLGAIRQKLALNRQERPI